MWPVIFVSCVMQLSLGDLGLNPPGNSPQSAAPAPEPLPPTSSSAPLPEAIVTRQTLFAIPFRVEREKDSAAQPAEVQLYVSHDRGAHWNYYSKVPAERQQIPFKTATDAEYWFALQTRDAAGKLRPERITAPGLRVVVDTQPPRLHLTAKADRAGQILIEWSVADPHWKSGSLILLCRSSADDPWETITLTPQNSRVEFSGTTETGLVTWWPPPGMTEIQLRAEASDAAGNKAVEHAQLKLDSNRTPKGDSPISSASKLGPSPSDPPNPAGGVLPGNVNPPIGNHYSPSETGSIDSSFSYLPPGERVRMVNTRLFELDYDVEAVGPSGISRVELWGTRNGGKTWRSYSVDNDCRSPISVAVENEGLYGFRIVLTNGVGLSTGPPQSGDPPAIWIGVDITKPTAQIRGADLGSGSHEGKLVITWEAEDAMPAARPITLSFSAQPGGPWTPIAAGLENTGRYVWTLDSRLPPQVYLRLEVRDEAGNLTVVERPEPVPLDRSRPTAKIIDVRPAGTEKP